MKTHPLAVAQATCVADCGGQAKAIAGILQATGDGSAARPGDPVDLADGAEAAAEGPAQ